VANITHRFVLFLCRLSNYWELRRFRPDCTHSRYFLKDINFYNFREFLYNSVSKSHIHTFYFFFFFFFFFVYVLLNIYITCFLLILLKKTCHLARDMSICKLEERLIMHFRLFIILILY